MNAVCQTAWNARSGSKPGADLLMLHIQPEASDLIQAEGLLAEYYGYDPSGTEPLFCFCPGLCHGRDQLVDQIRRVEAITVRQDLPLVVTVRHSSARRLGGREGVSGGTGRKPRQFTSRPDWFRHHRCRFGRARRGVTDKCCQLARLLQQEIVPVSLKSWNLHTARSRSLPGLWCCCEGRRRVARHGEVVG